MKLNSSPSLRFRLRRGLALTLSLLAALTGASSSAAPLEVRLVPVDVLVARPEQEKKAGELAADFLLFAPAGAPEASLDQLTVRWTCAPESGTMVLEATESKPAGDFVVRRFTGVFKRADGSNALDLEGPTLIEVLDRSGTPLRTMLSIAPKSHLAPLAQSPATPSAQEKISQTIARTDATHVPFVPGLKANEPTYFALGAVHGIHRLDARFQLSLRYQLVDTYGWARHLNVDFTTTSLWDLHSYSAPFRDTSYRPALVWAHDRQNAFQLGGDDRVLRFEPALAVEHESNGRGPDPDQPLSPSNNDTLSRSMNRVYFLPRFVWEPKAHGRVILSPKIMAPFFVDKINNPDIAKYRGYVDLSLKWFSSLETRSHVVSALVRQGTVPDRHYVELNYGLPMRVFGNPDANGWLLVQFLYGYGETLRDYRVHNPGTWRFGYMLVP